MFIFSSKLGRGMARNLAKRSSDLAESEQVHTKFNTTKIEFLFIGSKQIL